MPLSSRSDRRNTPAVRPRRSAAGGGSRSSREHSTGTIVTATNSDIASEKDTTAASWPNMMLDTPVRNSIGTNTAIWVSVEARIALHTSSAPSIAAVIRSLPISRWRWVFSSTTIAASTIMPMPSARPPKVSVFSV
jgi:hypothetical protein